MNKKKYLLVVFFAIFMIGGLYAQPGNGGGDGNGNELPGAPIDGGIIALIVGGAAYGFKKIKNN